MAIPDEALDLIKSFEGYLKAVPGRPGWVRPYLCPANVATIGWGNTRYPDGRRVQMSDAPISQETATRYLAHELQQDEASVDALTAGVELHPLMRGALVSFVYNCGAGAFRGSGLRRAVLARRWDDVPRELAKWRMGGGRVLPGLVRRRVAEANMFMKGVALMKRGDKGATPTAVPAVPAVPAPQRQTGSVFTRALKWVFGRR
jgi:lysozyme